MEAAAKRDNLILQVADAIRKKCIDPYGGFPYVSFSATCYRRHVRDNPSVDNDNGTQAALLRKYCGSRAVAIGGATAVLVVAPMKLNDGPAPAGEAPAADAHQGMSEQSAGSGAPLRRIAVAQS
jgi:hypothetical protein